MFIVFYFLYRSVFFHFTHFIFIFHLVLYWHLGNRQVLQPLMTVTCCFVEGSITEAAALGLLQDKVEPSGAGHHPPELECSGSFYQSDPAGKS